jgi:hypothetical protein
MNIAEFESKEFFTVKELAEIFDRTVVRVWQVLDQGLVPFKARDGEERRSKMMVPKKYLPVLAAHFGLATVQTENLKLVRPGRPVGTKNKPGHKAGRPRKEAAKRRGRPLGAKDSKPRKPGRWPTKAPQVEVPQVPVPQVTV